MSFKQVIIVRKDLKMSEGKTSAQVAHASLSCAVNVMKLKPEWFKIWTETGQKKVVLECKDLKELMELKDKAKEKGLYYEVIKDKGLTEVKPGTITVLGIGPGPEHTIDEITGHLKLL